MEAKQNISCWSTGISILCVLSWYFLVSASRLHIHLSSERSHRRITLSCYCMIVCLPYKGSAKRWKKFVDSECPEKEKFPQEWKNKNSLQKLCMMRALRPDRMTYAVMWVAHHLLQFLCLVLHSYIRYNVLFHGHSDISQNLFAVWFPLQRSKKFCGLWRYGVETRLYSQILIALKKNFSKASTQYPEQKA